ncbi:DUF1775 domain-containing protein [Myceligenerans crystallogenes]|uniref:YncI copper-binding domain-containing protein n=1 Tax=Myceligenerans crystallogenes TaxID=316335 RepID=A0ABP4ZJR5_9MICO
MRPTAARGPGVAVAATALLLMPAAPASAHVSIGEVAPNGDGTTTLTFVFDHGCEGSPTYALHMDVPEGVEALSAGTLPEGWNADVQPQHVAWTGQPVQDGDTATMTLDVRVTGRPGQSFAFPTQQVCIEGHAEWTDPDPSGEMPAPAFVATGASIGESAAPPAGTPSAPAPGASPAPAAAPADATIPTGPLIAGVAGIAAAAGIAGAWVTARRRRA